MHKTYDEDQLFSLAFTEFISLKTHMEDKDNKSINNIVSRNGALFCFCDDHIKDDGDSIDTVYTFSFSDPKSTNVHDITEISSPICKKYYMYMTGWGYLLQQTFNYLVVGASFAFRAVFIWLAEKLRFVSLTAETNFIMLAVFYVTYINYGFIYAFASLDLRHSSIPIISTLFNGLYPEFNSLWYNDIGVLIYNIMVSNMYWPVLEFFIYYGLRLLARMID